MSEVGSGKSIGLSGVSVKRKYLNQNYRKWFSFYISFLSPWLAQYVIIIYFCLFVVYLPQHPMRWLPEDVFLGLRMVSGRTMCQSIGGK